MQSEYRKFCKAAGLPTRTERLQVAGFGRSEASKAVWSYKKAAPEQLHDVEIAGHTLYSVTDERIQAVPKPFFQGVSNKVNGLAQEYAKGVLDSTWSRVCDAINRADGQMGVVLNRQQQYVWERGNRQESYQANLDEVPDVVLSGTIDENTLQQSLGADYTVMNLTGCSLDSVLYQVSKGNPVIAKVSDTVNVVIIGYNSKNTILYYPATQEQGYFGMQDSTSLFESAGNVFVGYMDNLGAASKSE